MAPKALENGCILRTKRSPEANSKPPIAVNSTLRRSISRLCASSRKFNANAHCGIFGSWRLRHTALAAKSPLRPLSRPRMRVLGFHT